MYCAWRIPGTGEPGGLPSMESHRVGHDWSDLAAAAAVYTMEKAMTPHSSTLAWKIPWTEEPGRLQSTGSQESDTTERLHFLFSLLCIGERNGNPLQCSCLENPRDRGAWWAASYGVAQQTLTSMVKNWKWFMYCWSLAWRILSIPLLACERSAIVWYFEHSLASWWLRS